MHGVGAEELQYLALITRNVILDSIVIHLYMRLLLLGVLAVFGLGCQVRPAVTTAPEPEQIPIAEPAPTPEPSPAPVFAEYDGSYCHLHKRFCDRMHNVLWDERGAAVQPILVTKNRTESTMISEWNAFLEALAPDVRATLLDPLLLQVPQQALIDDGVMGPYIDPMWLRQHLTSIGIDRLALVYWDFPAIMHHRFMKSYDLIYRGRLPYITDSDEEEQVIAWLAYLTRGYETILNQ